MRSIRWICPLALILLTGCGAGTAPTPPVQAPAAENRPAVPAPAATLAAGPNPLHYARKGAFLGVHLDLRAVTDTQLFKNLDPNDIPGDGVEFEHFRKQLSDTREWASVSYFFGPAEQDAPAAGSMFGVMRTPEGRTKCLTAIERILKRNPEMEYRGSKYTPYFSEEKGTTRYLLLVGDRAFYFGSESAVREMIQARGAMLNPELVKLLESVARRGQIQLAVNVEAARDTVASYAQKYNKFQLPEMNAAPDWTQSITLAVDLSGKTLFDFQIEAVNEAKARDWQSFLKGTTEELAGITVTKDTTPSDHPINQLFAMGHELIKVQVQQNGSRVSLSIPRPEALDQVPKILVAVMRRMTDDHVAGLIGIAILKKRAEADTRALEFVEAGVPILSWRVRILPHLDQGELSNRLHLTEPWNSERNFQAASEVDLEVLKTPFRTKPGTTTWKYLPSSPGGVMLVEGGEGSAKFWTEPETMKIDPAHPLALFGKEPPDGYTVVSPELKIEQLTGEQLKERLLKK